MQGFLNRKWSTLLFSKNFSQTYCSCWSPSDYFQLHNIFLKWILVHSTRHSTFISCLLHMTCLLISPFSISHPTPNTCSLLGHTPLTGFKVQFSYFKIDLGVQIIYYSVKAFCVLALRAENSSPS